MKDKNKKESNCFNPFSIFPIKEKKIVKNKSFDSESNSSSFSSTSSSKSSNSSNSSNTKKRLSRKKVYTLNPCQICKEPGIQAFAICWNCDNIFLCRSCSKICKICERTHCIKCYFHNKHDCYDISKYDTYSDTDSDTDSD